MEAHDSHSAIMTLLRSRIYHLISSYLISSDSHCLYNAYNAYELC